MKRHFSILWVLFFFSFPTEAQVPFSYTDINGNQFHVSSSKDFFAKFDTTFLKSNLTGERLELGNHGDTIRFLVKIVEIKMVNRYNYEIRLQKYPLTSDPIEILKTTGYSHYQMKVRYKKGKPYCESIEFLEFEI